MAFSGQVLDNPISGERFIFHKTADDTAGELLAFDLVVDPAGRVPGGHVHPVQQESFQVLSGTMRFKKGLRMEQLYEAVVALANEGRTLRSGMPKPLDLAMFMREFEQKVRAPVAPGLVRAVMAPLAWMAMRRGLDQRYRSLSGLAARRPAPTHPGAGRVAGTRPGPARPPRSRPGTPGAAGRQRVTGRRG